MRRLRVLLCAVLALLGPAALASAACPDATPSDTSPCGPLFTLPQWSDDGGWDAESAWSTIQLGRVDGGRGLDLIGRDATGLWVHVFDSSIGQWTLAGTANGGPAADLQDALGWDQPTRYATVQTGDLDGDGQDELLARAADGMQVFTWQAGGGYVRTDAGTGLFPDRIGWGNPQYANTIQTADVDGNGPAELLGRGGRGIETYRYDTAQRRFVAAAPILGELSDPGMAAPANYETIQTADVDGDARAELIARETGGVRTFTWSDDGWTPAGPVLPLSDAAGWSQPQYYRTIQTADLDADGRAELLARDAAGLHAWRWQGGWTPLGGGAAIGDLSDAAGFTLPQQYETILTADLDGDRKAEVIARTGAGVRVWSWTGTAWAGREAAPLPLTGDTWQLAQHYGTFRAGDVDGDGADELVVRGDFGIRTFRFDTATRQFARPRAYGAFPAFTGDRATAYAALGQFLLGRATDFRLATYATPSNAITQATLDGYRTQLAAQCVQDGVQPGMGARPPRYRDCRAPASGVDPGAWTDVTNQITAELWAASGVSAYFDVLDGVMANLYRDEQGELPAIDADLKLPPKPPDVAPDLLELISSGLDLLTDLAELFPETSAVAQFIRDFPRVIKGIGLMSHALGAASAGLGLAGEPRNPPETWADITNQVARMQQRQRDITQASRRYAMADYGLLMAVGGMSQGRLLTLDTTSMLSSGRRAFTTWAYQMYLPAYWTRFHVQYCAVNGLTQCTPPDAAKAPLVMLPPTQDEVQWDPNDTDLLTLNHRGSSWSDSWCYALFAKWAQCQWTDQSVIAKQVWAPVADTCHYDPTPGATGAWRYGCSIGADVRDMLFFRDGWSFRAVACDLKHAARVGFWGQDACDDDPYTVITAGSTGGGSGAGTALGMQARHSLGAIAPSATSVVVDALLVESPGRGAERELATHLTGLRHRPLRLVRRGRTPTASVYRGRAGTQQVALSVNRGRLSLRVHGLRLRAPEACSAGARRVTLETRLRLRHAGRRTGDVPVTLRGSWSCRRAAAGTFAGLRR